jgi:ABC-2 type transport system ATP-binding protein
MIEVTGLTKYYGPIPAIEDVTFSVAKGEIIGFLGPNGAGKTTTMRILTGFSPPTRGTAVVAGYDISKDPINVKRRVGYMPESVPAYNEMLVESFLRYVAEVKGVSRSQRKKEVADAMERCGLEQMIRRKVGNLSKGFRQRVGLAQALIGNPPVLILDEPTVGLDPRQIIEIRQMIKDLAKDHTVLISTHILPEVTMVCERVLIINKGRIVAQDRMENLATGASALFDVEVDGAEDAVNAVFAKIPEIQSFTLRESGRYSVEGLPGSDLGPPIAAGLVGANLRLRTLQRQSRTLEDIFINVISGEEGGPVHA